MTTTTIQPRTARPLPSVIPSTTSTGRERRLAGKPHWLKPLAILCCLVNAAAADTFGLFTYTDNGTSITITDYPVTEVGAVEIPASIAGNPVTSIGNLAFNNCSKLTSITIPNTVASIGSSAFSSCTGLTSVTIPAGVTSIGSGAFASCSKLTSITIPNGVTSIEDRAFYTCRSLTSIMIPDGVTSIGSQAFQYCSGLISITIPNNVTRIGDKGFWSCTSLTSIVIGNSVTSIGPSAFGNCTKLPSVYFMGNAPVMGWAVFDYGVSDFTVYYFNGKTGFTSPTWTGYTSVGLPPLEVFTGAASGITEESATLQGSVNPNGFTATAKFEYGLTASYGSMMGVILSPDNGLSMQAVSASISGLLPGRTYHYRLIATNSAGTSAGADMTFSAGHVLTINAINGTALGAGLYAPGITVELTAIPSPGYLFTGWTGDATGTTNPLSVLMDADKTIGATFTPDTADDDGDGLTNYQEIVEYGTDPTEQDTDGDGVNDKNDGRPLDPAETLDTDRDGTGDNADTDDDGDGYSDQDEINIHHTNPKRADSDGDGLTDPAELETHHTNPNVADTDNDGLRDGEEFTTHHTNPLVGDTDGDGFLDGYEVLTGKLPLDPLDKPALVAEARTAIEFTFPAAIGKYYRIEESTDLSTWTMVESGIIGTGGQVQRFYSTRGQPKRYFRVEEIELAP